MSSSAGQDLGGRLSFAAPELGLTVAFAMTNSWYLYFLVEVVGLSPLLGGIAFALGRIADAVFDPLVGSWSDRLAGRRGRKRLPGLAMVPAGVCFGAMWLLPTGVDGTALRFLMAVGGFCAFSFFYTMISVPRMALLPGIEPHTRGRTVQTVWNTVFVFLGAMAATALVPLLVGGGTGDSGLSGTNADDWTPIVIGAGVVLVAAVVPFLMFVREPEQPVSDCTGAALDGSISRLLRAETGRWPLLVFLAACIVLFGTQAGLPFFFEYRLGLTASEQATSMAILFATAFLSFPAWSWVSGRIGNARSLALGMIPLVIFFAYAATLSPGQGPALAAACVIAGLGIAPLNIFPWALVPGAVEAWCRDAAPGQEGLATSVFTFTFKLGGAIAVFGVASALEVLEMSGASAQGRAGNAAFLIVPALGSAALLLLLGTPRAREAHP